MRAILERQGAIPRWPEPVRRCAAARLYVECLDGRQWLSAEQRKAGQRLARENELRLSKARETVERFRDSSCQGSPHVEGPHAQRPLGPDLDWLPLPPMQPN
jgi:hypothetical protein